MFELKNRKKQKLQQDKRDISDQINIINKKIVLLENTIRNLREKRVNLETQERHIVGEIHHLEVGDYN